MAESRVGKTKPGQTCIFRHKAKKSEKIRGERLVESQEQQGLGAEEEQGLEMRKEREEMRGHRR